MKKFKKLLLISSISLFLFPNLTSCFVVDVLKTRISGDASYIEKKLFIDINDIVSLIDKFSENIENIQIFTRIMEYLQREKSSINNMLENFFLKNEFEGSEFYEEDTFPLQNDEELEFNQRNSFFGIEMNDLSLNYFWVSYKKTLNFLNKVEKVIFKIKNKFNNDEIVNSFLDIANMNLIMNVHFRNETYIFPLEQEYPIYKIILALYKTILQNNIKTTKPEILEKIDTLIEDEDIAIFYPEIDYTQLKGEIRDEQDPDSRDSVQ